MTGTVAVYVDPSEKDEGQIHIARTVADKFRASVVGISAFAVEPPFIAGGVVIKETTEDDIKRMKAALIAKGKWFERTLGMAEEKVEWRWGVEYPTVFLANEARCADLVVLKGKQAEPDYFNFLDPSEALLRVGRPILSVPDKVSQLSADRVVVGWKDAREARIAVRDAIPFLTKASQVTIIEVCKPNEQDLARRRVRDVAKYLQHHGAKCQAEVRVHMHEADASQLIRLANEEGADLIVTGGYGHSRLREWVFGGMTRGLLDEAPMCLFMSH